MISPQLPGVTQSSAVSDALSGKLPPAQQARLDRAQGTPLIEVSGLPARLPELQAGEVVTAQVREALPGGKLAVQIKGEEFLLQLPGAGKPDTAALSLRIASLQPLAFALLDEQAAPQTAQARALASSLQLLADSEPVALETLAQPGGKLPNFVAGEWLHARVAERLPDGSAVVLAKNAAFTLRAPEHSSALQADPLLLRVRTVAPQLLFEQVPLPQSAAHEQSAPVSFSPASRYLSTLLGMGAPGSAAAALVQGALLADPTQAPEHYVQQLQQAVERSGVFYESHQKAWVDGRRSLDELQQEPQARLAANHAVGADAATGKATISPELGPLVQRQLDTLEQRQFQFQGLAWPGQPLEWQLSQEEVHEREAGDTPEMPAWQTRLSLQLPALGGLAARLRLVGPQLQLMFDADSDAAAQLISQHRQHLISALESAGLSLASLQIKHENEAP